jgi:hypothetical protein
MKQVLRGLLYFSLLTAATGVLADCDSGSCSSTSGSGDSDTTSCCFPDNYNRNNNGNIYGMTNFATHPVQWDAFRRMSGVSTEKLHLFNQEEFYGTVSLALQYQQTSEANHLAQWFLFNNNSKNSMSYAPNADSTGAAFGSDINSLNFGVTSTGIISFQPKIQNFIADIDLYMGWDQFACGLWSRISLPINWTRWNMNLCDDNTNNPGSSTFPTDLMTANTAVTVPYANLKQAWVGDKTFGDAVVMTSGRIDDAKSVVRVAGLKLELGYDFIRKEDRHFAASFLVVAPTGNAPQAEYLFEPISGANKQWEIGVDFNGHYNFWERAECNKSLGVHYDIALMGMTKHNQKRLFGLKAGGDTSPVIAPSCAASAGSAWLLLKEFDSAGDYAGVLTSAANVLALNANIGSSFETNFGVLIKYIHNHFSFDVGYELFYRNAEKLNNRTAITANKYGIKGGLDVDLNADETASTSTISVNGAADASPVYVKDTDVCECTALHPAYLSSKLFSFYEYSWDNCDWQPTVGAGYSFEWGNERSGVKNIAVNQWSLIAKGSVSF